MKRLAYMVFSHCEWKAVYPSLHEAQEAASEYRHANGQGSVMPQAVTLEQLQEVLEEEIEDEEWDQYKTLEEHQHEQRQEA